jgi:hypothetical protein
MIAVPESGCLNSWTQNISVLLFVVVIEIYALHFNAIYFSSVQNIVSLFKTNNFVTIWFSLKDVKLCNFKDIHNTSVRAAVSHLLNLKSMPVLLGRFQNVHLCVCLYICALFLPYSYFFLPHPVLFINH